MAQAAAGGRVGARDRPRGAGPPAGITRARGAERSGGRLDASEHPEQGAEEVREDTMGSGAGPRAGHGSPLPRQVGAQHRLPDPLPQGEGSLFSTLLRGRRRSARASLPGADAVAAAAGNGRADRGTSTGLPAAGAVTFPGGSTRRIPTRPGNCTRGQTGATGEIMPRGPVRSGGLEETECRERGRAPAESRRVGAL